MTMLTCRWSKFPRKKRAVSASGISASGEASVNAPGFGRKASGRPQTSRTVMASTAQDNPRLRANQHARANTTCARASRARGTHSRLNAGGQAFQKSYGPMSL